MNPRRLLSDCLPRWVVTGAVLLFNGCQPCPASDAAGVTEPGPVTPALSRPQTLYLTWAASPSPGVTGYRLYSFTAGNARVGAQTNAVELGNVTHQALTDWPRAKWFFAVTARVGELGESELSELAEWPPESWALSNRVVTVFSSTATAESLAGPWLTNTAVLWQATNPPGMKFWQTGLSITVTNF